METRSDATRIVKKELANSRVLLAETIEQSKVADAYAELLRSKITMLEQQVMWCESRLHHLESEALTEYTKAFPNEESKEGEAK